MRGAGKNSILCEKSLNFAVRIVKFYKYLCEEKQEYVLSKQVLRCGTSIGANLSESRNAQSNADFISKINIALKEANETHYWLELFLRSEIIPEEFYFSLNQDLEELIAMLVSALKTLKKVKGER